MQGRVANLDDHSQRKLSAVSCRRPLTCHPVRAQLDTGIMAERQRLMDEWEEWYKGKAEWLAWAAEGAAKLLGKRAAELPFTVEEVEVEETLGKPVEEVLKA